MNQILINQDKNKQKRKKTTGLLDMRKVIIVFSVLIIIFALIIVGAMLYGNLRDKEKSKDTPIENLNKPVIKIEQEGQQCKIRVDYDEGLDKISYSWNDGDLEENNMNGSTMFDKLIDIPEGNENKLYVKAIGLDNSESESTKVFKKEEIREDPDKPKIRWVQEDGTNIMTIIATSEKGIDKLTYQWENEETVTIEGNGKEMVQQTIEIKRGTNKMKIIAKDMEGNEQEKEENLIGILFPEINVYMQGDILNMTVKHDMGFKKIIFKINDAELVYDENNPQYDKNLQEVQMNLPLEPGQYTVEITAYSLEHENSVKTYKGETVVQ